MPSNPSIADDLPPFSERKVGAEEIQILMDKIAALHNAEEVLKRAFRSDDSPSSELPIPGVPSATIPRDPLQRRQDMHDRHAHIHPIIDQLEQTARHLIEELIEATTEAYVGVYNKYVTLGCVIPISRHYPQFIPRLQSATLRLTFGAEGEKRFVKIIEGDTKTDLEFGGNFVYDGLEIVAFKEKTQAEAWLQRKQQLPAND